MKKLRIVDVGAGTGFTTEGVILHNPSAEVTMLDQSDHQFKEAKKKASIQEKVGERMIIGDSHDLPFEKESFDRWISAGSVEYWPDPQKAMDEAFRILKPGGVATLIGPARPTHWFAKFIADLWYLFPEPKEYMQWYSTAGFEDIQILPIQPEWYSNDDRKFGLIMGYIIYGRKSLDPKVNQKGYDAAAARATIPNEEAMKRAVKDVEGFTVEGSAFVAKATLRYILGALGCFYYAFLPAFIGAKTAATTALLHLFGHGPAIGNVVGASTNTFCTTLSNVVVSVEGWVGKLMYSLMGWMIGFVVITFVEQHLKADKPEDAKKGGDISITTVWKLARPHTIKGTATATIIGYFVVATFTLQYFRSEHLTDVFCVFVSGLAINIYIVAVNQLTDVEIDRENQKLLPVATGELSWENAQIVTRFSFLLASTVGLGCVHTTWWVTIMGIGLLGTLYSVPPYRFKRWSTPAALCIAISRALIAIYGGLSTYLEIFGVMQTDLAEFPIWNMCFTFMLILFVFCSIIAIMKDVPDEEGDRKAKVQTLVMVLGSRNLMLLCLVIVTSLYLGIIAFFLTGFGGLLRPCRIDLTSLVTLHLVALSYLVGKFYDAHCGVQAHKTKNPEEYRKLCTQIYLGVIWPLFYFEFVAFPLPCILEMLKYRGVLNSESYASAIVTVVVIVVVQMLPMFVGWLKLKFGYAKFRKKMDQVMMLSNQINQGRQVKSQICEFVIGEIDKMEDVFSRDNKELTDKRFMDEVCQRFGTAKAGLEALELVRKSVPADVDPIRMSEPDVKEVQMGIQRVIGISDLQILHDAAGHLFKNPGKMIRSRIITLMGQTLAETLKSAKSKEAAMKHVYALGEVVEMEHTASLMHDDVVDESDERRGSASASKAFGNKMAILAGDFLFTRALLLLTSEIRHADVTADISRSMENLVKGEILQMAPYKNLHIGRDAYDPQNTEIEDKLLKMYEIKTYHKTASLFSYMCTGVARIVLQEKHHLNGTNGTNGTNGSKCEISDDDFLYYAAGFGRQFGMAFQIVDDLLDYDHESAQLGKPVGQDMKLGLATLPVILASRRYPMKLRPLILRNFENPGDIDIAMHVLRNEDKNKAFEESHQYVEKHIQKALTCLFNLPKCAARDALVKVTLQYQHRKE